jgi:hypothetical protein
MRGKALPEPMKLFNAPEGTAEPKPIADHGPKVLLKVENLVTRFPVKGGLLRRTIANVHAVEDVSLEIKSRPDAEPRGRIRLRQSPRRAVDPAAGGADLSGKVELDGTTSWRWTRRSCARRGSTCR